MMMDYLNRLNKARILIEKAYKEKDYESLGKLAKRLQPLHMECYKLWQEGSFEEDPLYSYAEYLKYLIYLSFQGLYQYNSKPAGLIDICRKEALAAGIRSVV